MNHPLRCGCGAIQGHIERSPSAVRAVCYCRDCQAYARFLGTSRVTDESGGTEVVAFAANHLRFTAGLDALACASLSERGILRWYAGCCNTPIANTPRDPRIAYVGVVHSCVDAGPPKLEDSFGPLRIAVNTNSARGRVRSTPVASTFGVARLVLSLAAARLGGAYRTNPFFESDLQTPIRPVHVLTAAERERAYRDR